MKNLQENDIKRLFRAATFPVSMRFKDDNLESQYLINRNNIDSYYKMVISATFFNIYVIVVRVIYDYFASVFEIHEVKGSINLYIYISILTICLMLLEILPARIKRIEILKGFFIIIVPFFVSLYQSYNFSVSYLSPYPVFYGVQIFMILAAIPVAFIYCYNWICGFVFISLLILSNEIYLLIYNWPVMDKMFMTYINLASYVSLVTCLRFIENCRKENFFRVHLVNENNKNTQCILMSLPDPVIIVSSNKIEFKNTSYNKMTDDISRSLSSEREHQLERHHENKEEKIET